MTQLIDTDDWRLIDKQPSSYGNASEYCGHAMSKDQGKSAPSGSLSMHPYYLACEASVKDLVKELPRCFLLTLRVVHQPVRKLDVHASEDEQNSDVEIQVLVFLLFLYL
jgi:hypothetical protein